jgi:hypothetical protein
MNWKNARKAAATCYSIYRFARNPTACNAAAALTAIASLGGVQEMPKTGVLMPLMRAQISLNFTSNKVTGWSSVVPAEGGRTIRPCATRLCWWSRGDLNP